MECLVLVPAWEPVALVSFTSNLHVCKCQAQQPQESVFDFNTSLLIAWVWRMHLSPVEMENIFSEGNWN